MIYVTGDLHGYIGRVVRFCEHQGTARDDVLVVLGDAGINYWRDESDEDLKRVIADLPITLLCIHGNHEVRPQSIPTYEELSWSGGAVYREPEYPNVLFAKDGSIFDMEGRRTLVIGGAYSVDKPWRLRDGRLWFADEQPDEMIKADVEAALDRVAWEVDDVMTHTAPYSVRPLDAFISTIDQSTVDTSTEEWLDRIAAGLTFERWWSGHFHIDSYRPPFGFLFRQVHDHATGELVYHERDLT